MLHHFGLVFYVVFENFNASVIFLSFKLFDTFPRDSVVVHFSLLQIKEVSGFFKYLVSGLLLFPERFFRL